MDVWMYNSRKATRQGGGNLDYDTNKEGIPWSKEYP